MVIKNIATVACSLLILEALSLTEAHAVKEPAATGLIPDAPASDSANTWTWSGMTDYDDPDLESGRGHAGGPFTYGVFTFSGTGIDIYGERCPVVPMNQAAHKTGRVKITLDGRDMDPVDLYAPEKDPHFKIAGISGLPDAIHVLQLQAVGGWIVIGAAKVTQSAVAAPVDSPVQPAATGAALASLDARHLMARWPLNDGAGTVAADKSGRARAATLVAGATWSSEGKNGGDGCIAFPGPGGLEMPGPAVDTSQSFTVSAWVRLASLNGFQTFVSTDGSAVSAFCLQYRGDSHRFAFQMLPSDTSMTPTYASAAFIPDIGVWYHVAGGYDASSDVIALFVNGVLQDTKPFTTHWRAMGDTAIGRGKYGGTFSGFASGKISDVRLYDRALSPADMTALYNGTK